MLQRCHRAPCDTTWRASTLRGCPSILLDTTSAGDPVRNRLGKVPGLAGDDELDGATRKRALLFCSSNGGRLMDDVIADLDVPSVLEPWMEASIPKDEHIQIAAIPDDERKSPLCMAEGVVLSHALTANP